MKESIKKVLEQIRPLLQKDGGDVEFVDVDESGVVSVKLKGSCGCCPGAMNTLKNGIERTLKQHVPEVREVVRVV
ncbi:MAG: NifU family protein [Bacillota bacterium]